MQNKGYKIGDCVIALESEEQIGDSSPFVKFLSKENASITVRIVHGDLPPETGRLLFRDKARKVYSDGNIRYTYCSYFNSAWNRYTEFACRVTKGGQELLFIDYPNELWDKMIFEALDLPELLLRTKKVILHCSFVYVNGRALLFSADKQVGKSTQATLWKKYAGGEIINGDRAIVGLRDGKLTAWGLPFCGTSNISENMSAPVEAIVMLSQGPVNTIKELTPGEIFKGIIGKITYHQWDLTSAEAAADAACLIAGTKVYGFSCLPDESAVRALEKELCWK